MMGFLPESQSFRENWMNQLPYFLVLCLAISLPLPRNVSTLVVVVFGCLSLWKSKGRIHWRPILPYLLFFSWSCLALFWTEDRESGIFLLTKQLLVLVMPLLFAALGPIPEIWHRKIRLAFAWSTLGVLLLSLLLATVRYQKESEYALLFYHNLAGNVGFSALYLSMYLVMGMVIFTGELFEKDRKRATSAPLVLVCVALLSVGVILLASRTSILAMFLTLFLAIVWYRKEVWGIRLRWVLAGILLTGVLATYSIPLLKERLQEAINFNNQYSLERVGGGTSFRLAKWQAVETLWEKCLPAGLGIGDVQHVLNRQYLEDEHPQLLNLNAHNQYFQTALGLGVPGLLLLVVLVFYPVLSKPIRFFPLSFCLLFAICIFTESMLEVQKGVLFFTFFSGLLLITPKPEGE